MRQEVAAAAVAVIVAATGARIVNPAVPADVSVTVMAFGVVRLSSAIAAGFVTVTVVLRSVKVLLARSAASAVATATAVAYAAVRLAQAAA